MAKKALVREYDKFMLRLPPGMRDRIKTQSERMGMSMNEAIVHCLEDYFPRPSTFEDRIEHLAELVAALKDGSDLESRIDEISLEIEKTLHDVSADKLSVNLEFAEKVSKRIETWELEKEEERKRFGLYGPYEDDHSDGEEEPPYTGAGDPFSLDDEPIKGKE